MYRFRDKAIYWQRVAIFSTPLSRGFPLEYCHTVWSGTRSSAVAKRPRDASCLYSFYTLEWCGYPMVKKIRNMFIRFDMIHERNKNRRFHVPQPTFLFSLETPLRLLRNMLHGLKDNLMLAKLFAACTYLSSIVSELYDA